VTGRQQPYATVRRVRLCSGSNALNPRYRPPNGSLLTSALANWLSLLPRRLIREKIGCLSRSALQAIRSLERGSERWLILNQRRELAVQAQPFRHSFVGCDGVTGARNERRTKRNYAAKIAKLCLVPVRIRSLLPSLHLGLVEHRSARVGGRPRPFGHGSRPMRSYSAIT
jgi:hypothetical protein